MKDIYIVAAKRTPIGSFMGSLSTIPATKLGACVISDILKTTKIDPKNIDDVIIGQVLTGGNGQNAARQTAIYAGLPNEVPAMTINRVCGSSLQAVASAAASIKAGDAHLIIAGGQENMSLAEHSAYMRGGVKFGEVKFKDMMMYDGLTDVFSDKLMGVTAENIASKFKINRKRQDQHALDSQEKALKAIENGAFKAEITPVEVATRKETQIFDTDEGPRPTSLEKLGKLKAAFDPTGSVTAGNSSTINDGASMLLIASAEAVKKYNLKPIAKIISYATAGVEPAFMGTGPAPASKYALDKAGWSIKSLDLIEANEAFSVQAIYVNDAMNWDLKKVNINGGAIALGHPIGASGARILTTLVHALNSKAKEEKKSALKGLATLCIGGGMGIAMCIETV